MEEVIKIVRADTQIDRADVLRLLDCHADSPVYEDVIEEYEELESVFYNLVKPQTRILFDEIPPELAGEDLPAGTKIIYLIHTAGSLVSEYSTQAFKEDDYLKGMIMNAMSSSYLFKMDLSIQDDLKRECAQRGVGVVRRLEAPRDIPMLAQKIACDKLFGKDHSIVSTTSAFMLDPPKSDCEIFVLSDDPGILHTAQDCSKCEVDHCPMRKELRISCSVVLKYGISTVTLSVGESILDALREQKLYSSAACGGTGRCGKCRIQFIDGATAPTYADRVHFSGQDLDKGMRLACQAFPTADCTIRLDFPDESVFEILTENAFADSSVSTEADSNITHTETSPQDESYSIAIDIGTTTIAAALVGLESRKPAAYYTTLNRQRMFGADVISRIQTSSDGKADQLQQLVREDILQCITRLAEDNAVSRSRIMKVVLAGNTTMGHLLRGYPCQTLGVYPFTPYRIEEEELGFSEMTGSKYLDCPVTLFPGISTYVGGDIVSGLLSCGYASEEKINLFIDLGTNGEMAVGCKGRILVTSTAAGPAFEGGNILWGTGSIQGAISGVTINGDDIRLKTIGGVNPVGICGTGIIEVIAELLKNDLIDETGKLDDRYFKDGFPLSLTDKGETIMVTQRDIREIQLAKSAVRAGVEVLLKRFGTDYSGIDTVWLAGGFGVKIDQDKAIAIGMLPEEFRGKIKAVGNTSLGGAIRYSLDKNESGKIKSIVSDSTEIALANDKDFNQLYVDYMFF